METRTSGAEGGPGKRARRNPGTAPRPDPYEIKFDEGAGIWSARYRSAFDQLTAGSCDELRQAIRVDYQERRQAEQRALARLQERSSI